MLAALDGVEVAASDLPFGVHVDTHAEEAMRALTLERDEWQERAEKYTRAFENLERRVYNKAIPELNVPADVVRRLNRLDNENKQLQAENIRLSESLKASQCENSTLEDEIVGQKNKMKGAGKKVRNAKDLACKEGEKAKNAVHDKRQRVSSERKMKAERNEARAELEKYKKENETLLAKLETEQSGRPHLREDGIESDYTTVAIPVEFKIHRGDFLKLFTVFESNQITITDKFGRWYKDWKKPKDEVAQVVGSAEYAEAKNAGKKGVDLYEDMIEAPEGWERYPETGAEHDGWRSKRSLRAICRQAEARHNSQA
jgi:chromosome segregation ATPase